ncbi:HEPN domain-containing protein [Acidithiobacillus sp. M4-SHS-6]|uniref:HEPN domain-containing protein n=1 Tax=Acidithiobacillus sp. M4-SHS-6 TaxID=3383024 RepID=UPI0039BDDB2C
MSASENLERSRQWFDAAFTDLEAVQALMDRNIYSLACFFAQQSAEKAMKGFLIAAGKAYPKEHSLENLRGLLPENAEISRLAPNRLDRYYIAPRYPESLPLGSSVRGAYDRTDAEDALRVATGTTMLLAGWAQTLGVNIPWPNKPPDDQPQYTKSPKNSGPEF